MRYAGIVLAGVLASSAAVARWGSPLPSPSAFDLAANPRVLAEHGRQFEAMGEMDSAYAYYGRALAARDSTRQVMLELLDGAPAAGERRDRAAEEAFVREVRALVAGIPAGAARAEHITTADQAKRALEALLAWRRVRDE
jgi:hypothetical protein